MSNLTNFGAVVHLAGQRARNEIDDDTFSSRLIMVLEKPDNWVWLAVAIREYAFLVQGEPQD